MEEPARAKHERRREACRAHDACCVDTVDRGDHDRCRHARRQRGECHPARDAGDPDWDHPATDVLVAGRSADRTERLDRGCAEREPDGEDPGDERGRDAHRRRDDYVA